MNECLIDYRKALKNINQNMIKSIVETILLDTADRNVNQYSLVSNPKLNIYIPSNPGIPQEKPLLRITGGMYKSVHSSTIHSNKSLEQPKWPLSEENMLQYIHTMEYYTEIKINKV